MNKGILAKKRILVAVLLVLFAGCAGRKEMAVIKIPRQLSLDTGTVQRIHLRRSADISRPMPLLSVTAVGDLMMSSWIINVVRQEGVDYPFDSTRVLLQSSDFAIANLEAPLSDSGEQFEGKKFTFKVPPEFAAGIKKAGIDVLNLANNHILDFGSEGLRNTISTLDSMKIYHIGAGANRDSACVPTIVDYFGIRIAFLGFSMTFPKEFWASDTSCGTCYPYEKKFRRLVRQCEQDADLTIVSFHWGAEKRTTPKEYQIYYAHKAIDLGADLVLGHHPHVLQGLELYKNRLIAYSLGNYVFASYSEDARDSIVLQTMITPNGLLSARARPISVYNADVNFQPHLLYGADRNAVLQRLNELSFDLNNGRNILNGEGFIWPNRLIRHEEQHAEVAGKK
ncbi:MAG: CapA family protein [Calditrichaeota bacterium]|nr:CapA family protein [Calditrichota bacterium]